MLLQAVLLEVDVPLAQERVKLLVDSVKMKTVLLTLDHGPLNTRTYHAISTLIKVVGLKKVPGVKFIVLAPQQHCSPHKSSWLPGAWQQAVLRHLQKGDYHQVQVVLLRQEQAIDVKSEP